MDGSAQWKATKLLTKKGPDTMCRTRLDACLSVLAEHIRSQMHLSGF